MSNICNRYVVEEGVVYGREFDVWDEKEKRCICSCKLQKYAGMIAGVLNQIENDRVTTEEMGG